MKQLDGEIHSARVDDSQERVYVVSSYFIKHFLSERIETECVILMGCNGLDSKDMGEAWIEAGASSYVGWIGSIRIEETD